MRQELVVLLLFVALAPTGAAAQYTDPSQLANVRSVRVYAERFNKEAACSPTERALVAQAELTLRSSGVRVMSGQEEQRVVSEATSTLSPTDVNASLDSLRVLPHYFGIEVVSVRNGSVCSTAYGFVLSKRTIVLEGPTSGTPLSQGMVVGFIRRGVFGGPPEAVRRGLLTEAQESSLELANEIFKARK